MFHLVSGLYQQWTRKEELNVVILGLDNAGKTTLLERLKATYNNGMKMTDPSKIVPTIGLNLGLVEIGNVRINFWDLGGQKELRGIWDKYYAECHGLMFVVDSTDPSRLEEVQRAFEMVLSNELLDDTPIMVLANKSDAPGAMEVSHIKELFMHISMGAREFKVMATSALRGEGVRDSIDWLYSRLLKGL